MSPQATSVGFPPITWQRDLIFPGQPEPPTQGGGFAVMVRDRAGPPGIMLDSTAPNPEWIRSTTSGSGVRDVTLTVDNLWCIGIERFAVTTSIGGVLIALPHYTPQLAPGDLVGEDDGAHRIGWLQVFMRAGGANASVLHAIGASMIPDDGTVASTPGTYAPGVAGGFGVYRAVGSADYAWASYAPAGVLLDSQALVTTGGWQSFDFIIRQARAGDVSTPWLTLRHNGVDVLREVPMDGVLIDAPLSIRATAGNWAILLHGADAGGLWNQYYRLRWRQGSFHPDGYPVRS